MKALDRLLQRWRISKAGPYITPGARVLDVGCADGALFRQFEERIGEGVGIDDDLHADVTADNTKLLRGVFPESLSEEAPFDVITMMAVLEHVPTERQGALAHGCGDFLKPDGFLVITTPAPAVDHILDALKFLRLIDGMSLEEHYGFEPRETLTIFGERGFRCVRAETFQLGLNHLFVFQREADG